MIIRIHVDDGECFEFSQDDEDIEAALLESIIPGKLFSQAQLIIQADNTSLGFASAHLEWVEVEDHGEVPWAKHPSAYRMSSLPREIFHQKLTALQKGESLAKSTAETISLCEFIMSSGARLYVESVTNQSSPLAQRQHIQSLLHPGGLFIKGAEGSFLVVNPTCISRWNIYPPVAGLAEFAWLAKPIGQKE